MNRAKTLLLFVLVIGLVSCAPVATSVPTETATPTSTLAPTPTSTPKPTRTPIPTPEPIFVTIGSPFPPEWGTPLIWSNDAYNAPWYPNRNDDHHGHVDISVPVGYSVCEGFDIDGHIGDVRAPIGGHIRIYPDDPNGFDITPPDNVYPAGVLEVLAFAGIKNPSLKKITGIRVQFGHAKNIKTGWVEKGEVIAEIEPFNSGCGQTKLAFKVGVSYEGVEYAFTPTIFKLDIPWECFPNSPYDCIPEVGDYAP